MKDLWRIQAQGVAEFLEVWVDAPQPVGLPRPVGQPATGLTAPVRQAEPSSPHSWPAPPGMPPGRQPRWSAPTVPKGPVPAVLLTGEDPPELEVTPQRQTGTPPDPLPIKSPGQATLAAFFGMGKVAPPPQTLAVPRRRTGPAMPKLPTGVQYFAFQHAHWCGL